MIVKKRNQVPQFSFRPRSIVDEKLVMNRNENAVFDIILSIINEEDDDDVSVAENTKYILYAAEYAGYMGISAEKDAYKALRSGMKSLYEHDVVIGDEKAGMHMRIIQIWGWNASQKEIFFELTKDVKRMLVIEKKKNCNTFYIWKYSLPLAGKYAPKLYYCLKEWAKTGHRIDTVDNLKYILDFPVNDKYSEVHRKLESAVAEINAKTDICVSFSEITENVRGGAKVSKIKFNIKNKKNLPVVNAPALPDKTNFSLVEKTIRERLSGTGLSESTISAVVAAAEKNGLEKSAVIRRLDYFKDNMASLKNPAGFLIFAMSDSFTEEKINMSQQKKNRFHNFKQRGDDLDPELEKRYWELFTKRITVNDSLTDEESAELDEIIKIRG